MKTIYKYTLMPTVEYMEIPSDNILSCESRGDDIVVYAIVDTEDQKTRRFEFKVIGTGYRIDFEIEKYTFLNTVKLDNDRLVFHIFYFRVL